MTVYVKDGDLTKALQEFKQSVKKSGILHEYNQRQEFRRKRDRKKRVKQHKDTC